MFCERIWLSKHVSGHERHKKSKEMSLKCWEPEVQQTNKQALLEAEPLAKEQERMSERKTESKESQKESFEGNSDFGTEKYS